MAIFTRRRSRSTARRSSKWLRWRPPTRARWPARPERCSWRPTARRSVSHLLCDWLGAIYSGHGVSLTTPASSDACMHDLCMCVYSRCWFEGHGCRLHFCWFHFWMGCRLMRLKDHKRKNSLVLVLLLTLSGYLKFAWLNLLAY